MSIPHTSEREITVQFSRPDPSSNTRIYLTIQISSEGCRWWKKMMEYWFLSFFIPREHTILTYLYCIGYTLLNYRDIRVPPCLAISVILFVNPHMSIFHRRRNKGIICIPRVKLGSLKVWGTDRLFIKTIFVNNRPALHFEPFFLFLFFRVSVLESSN